MSPAPPDDTNTANGGGGLHPSNTEPVTRADLTGRAGILADAARSYRDNHHWVPLRLKGKLPDMGKAWTKRTLADAIPDFEDGDNIGVLLGKPSDGLVRLDPDFPTVATVTNILFPPSMVFGRASSPYSDRLLYCKDGIKTTNFKLPNSVKDVPRLPLHEGKPNLVVFQILSTGAQTMMPPSIHPETGEAIAWYTPESKIPVISGEDLLRTVGLEALCMVVKHFWPPKGTRNDAAMALARVLLETLQAHGLNEEEKLITTVDDLVEIIAMAGGDGEASRAGNRRARKTLEKMKAGEEAIGLTRLVELLALPPDVVKDFRKWLGLGHVQGNLSAEHFWSFGPMNQFFFVPSRALWPAASVNSRLPPFPVLNADGSPKLNKKKAKVFIPATTWLSQNRSVETMTWAPGHPSIIPDKIMTEDGGLVAAPGFKCFNTYRAPAPIRGDATKAGPWIDLVKKLYPNEAEHIFDFSAHRVQKPEEKINHCLVLIGSPGIGKDSILAPVLRAVGIWNCTEASPQDFFGAFNPHVKAVIMRINEAHDLGDVSRYGFYERMKIYAAAPPETLPVNDKNIRKYYIPNVCSIVITSNYRTDCLYLPADDRRNFVAASSVTKDDFADGYWTGYWKWLNEGGDQDVAAWLAARDISKFDAKAPPRKTPAFWSIVDANRPIEEAEIMDVLDALGNPDAITIQMIKDHIAPLIRIVTKGLTYTDGSVTRATSSSTADAWRNATTRKFAMITPRMDAGRSEENGNLFMQKKI